MEKVDQHIVDEMMYVILVLSNTLPFLLIDILFGRSTAVGLLCLLLVPTPTPGPLTTWLPSLFLLAHELFCTY